MHPTPAIKITHC